MNPRILLDLDGVLADFVAGAARLHNQDPATVCTYDFWKPWGISAADFWGPMDYDFWVNLPPTPEAREIIDLCERAVGTENVCVLTARLEGSASMEGARDWIRRHFSQFGRRMLMGPAKEFCASPASLLVDDSDSNREAFVKAGGECCLLPRAWNEHRTWAKLPVYFLKSKLEAFVHGR